MTQLYSGVKKDTTPSVPQATHSLWMQFFLCHFSLPLSHRVFSTASYLLSIFTLLLNFAASCDKAQIFRSTLVHISHKHAYHFLFQVVSTLQGFNRANVEKLTTSNLLSPYSLQVSFKVLLSTLLSSRFYLILFEFGRFVEISPCLKKLIMVSLASAEVLSFLVFLLGLSSCECLENLLMYDGFIPRIVVAHLFKRNLFKEAS